MTLIQLIVLALVQGLTEFLPISSSAHLILPAELSDWEDQGLAFDAAVHLGTLAAVVAYFRRDLWRMALAVRPRAPAADRRLLGWLVLATLPAVIVGAAAASWIGANLRSGLVIAWATIIFALFLWAADRFAPQRHAVEAVGWKRALWIGLAQVLALVPGTSRAGVTITAGLALGLTREAAARFSFLMSIPVIAAAGGLMLLKTLRGGEPVDATQFLIGVLVSGTVAWATIALFLAWLKRHGMTPFVVYRLALGILLLVLLHSYGS